MPETTIPAARRVRPLSRALTELQALGIPAWAVAEEAGISPALLSMVARGRTSVSPSTAEAIGRALGRDPSELFPEADVPRNRGSL
jgi:transcriptional regulator with XRE-family HTH domain